jgi:hypothetical protein
MYSKVLSIVTFVRKYSRALTLKKRVRRAGSLGVNMVAANRVVLFDCNFNPSYDLQVIDRKLYFRALT